MPLDDRARGPEVVLGVAVDARPPGVAAGAAA